MMLTKKKAKGHDNMCNEKGESTDLSHIQLT